MPDALPDIDSAQNRRGVNCRTLLETGCVLVVMLLVFFECGYRISGGMSIDDQLAVHSSSRKVMLAIHEVDRFRKLNGRLPTELSEIPGYEPTNVGKANASSVDAWGNPLIYEFGERRYAVHSLGADGVPGGTGAASDLSETLTTAIPVGRFAFLRVLPGTYFLYWACGVSLLCAASVLSSLAREPATPAPSKWHWAWRRLGEILGIAALLAILIAVGLAMALGHATFERH